MTARGLLLLLAVLGCWGCGRSDKSVVTLWHQMRPEDRAVLDSQIEEFELEHDVEVRAVYKETEELRSGLESAVLVGEGPDIVYGPSDPLGVYQAIGALQDLSDTYSDDQLDEFDPQALVRLPAADGSGEQLVMIGDRFGNHLALVYNRNQVPTPPRTTDELVAAAVANTVDENGDGRPDRYGLVWNYTEPFFVVPFITGYGGWVFEENSDPTATPVPALDTPEVVAGLDFVSSLRSKYKVLPKSADYNAADELFKAGKAAMIINGDWSWNGYLETEGIDAAVAPLPIVSSTGKPMAPMVAPKGYSISVAARDERLQLAKQLVKFLTSEQTQERFLTEQKILPSRLALRDSPEVRDDPTLVASLQQVENGRPMPTTTAIRAVWDGMRPAYQELMAGNIDAADAARKMQRDSVANIATLTQRVEPDATAPLVSIAGVAILIGLAVWQWRGLVALVGDFKHNRLAYLLVLPSVGLIFLTVLFPLAYNVVLSFSNMSLSKFRDWQIVGLHNYTSLLGGEQAAKFWGVFFKTLVWTVVNVVCHVVIGVFLAVVLNGPVRGKALYRVALIIPWAVPAYITALTWRGMFDPEFGAVNHVLRLAYIPPVNWLSDAHAAFAACIITNVWLGFPFMMVVALGGLQGIPKDLYEAAQVDRASRWQQFWHITVPMLRPVMLPAITLGTVWTFNNLNVIWLVSNGGEPADQTHILVSYVYKAVFNLYQYGYGAALSMVIFLMLLVFSVLFLQRTKAAEAVA
ncbi:extracellular solute-binding protein [Aeoliella sp.]|uniref:extracellular solute-binding protein n=1 Tax=Aeoliella sp. TaxID=2795800 RepID=UPI003CCBD2FA